MTLKRAWAEGQYGGFNVKVGKLPNSINLLSITDDPYSGAEMSYATEQGLKFTLAAGNVAAREFNGRFNKYSDGATYGKELTGGHARYYGLGVQYDNEENALSGGAAYQILDMSKVYVTDYENAANTGLFDNVRQGKDSRYGIWSLNAKYKFGAEQKAYFKAEYAKANADLNANDGHNNAYSFQLGYGEAKKEEAGTWGAYLAYRKLGLAAAPWSTYDDAIMAGQKGWEIGGEYTFAQNIVGFLKYGQGSDITDRLGKDDARKFFGRVDFFF